MGTPIVKGLTEVHHCATYSTPRPIYGLGDGRNVPEL